MKSRNGVCYNVEPCEIPLLTGKDEVIPTTIASEEPSEGKPNISKVSKIQ